MTTQSLVRVHSLLVAAALAVLLPAALSGCATRSPSGAHVEWAEFRLAAGVTEAALREASDRLQTAFLREQEGFIRRELLKGENGRWVDVVYWKDREAAEAAVNNAGNSPVCMAYFQLMAGENHHTPGEGVLHFQRVKTYSR